MARAAYQDLTFALSGRNADPDIPIPHRCEGGAREAAVILGGIARRNLVSA
jgi:hypothetical protein